METKFIRVTYNNVHAKNAETEEHKAIIEEQSERGFKYVGYFPVKMGPSGKILVVDLIFQR